MRTWIAIISLTIASSAGAGVLPLFEGSRVVVAGTSVRLLVLRELKSGVSKVGDPVLFEVAADVRAIDGAVLIPKGTRLSGHVTVSEKGRSFGRPGRLEWSCEAWRLPDGTEVALRTSARTAPDRVGGVVGAAILAREGAASIAFNQTLDPKDGKLRGGLATQLGMGLVGAVTLKGKNITLKMGEEVAVQFRPESLLPAPGLVPAGG